MYICHISNLSTTSWTRSGSYSMDARDDATRVQLVENLYNYPKNTCELNCTKSETSWRSESQPAADENEDEVVEVEAVLRRSPNSVPFRPVPSAKMHFGGSPAPLAHNRQMLAIKLERRKQTVDHFIPFQWPTGYGHGWRICQRTSRTRSTHVPWHGTSMSEAQKW